MNILVSGGAGFIGRGLVKKLILEGHSVRILDNFSLGAKNYILDMIGKVEVIEADIRNYRLVKKALKNVDLVYHLAAPSSFLMYEQNPLGCSIITIQGFLNILEGMRTMKVKKIIYASTSAVYEGNPLPYKEDMNLCPPDLKALSKKFNEEIAKEYSQRYGLETIGLRPFSVYGYGEETKGGYANIISLFIWTMLKGNRPVVWGDGNQTRDFIFVEDVVDAFMLAKDRSFGYEIFNIGTGKETTFNTVIQIINWYLGKELKPLYIPIPINIYAERLLSDTARQEKILGFKPKVSVETGIAKTLERANKTIKQYKKLSSCQTYFATLAVINKRKK